MKTIILGVFLLGAGAVRAQEDLSKQLLSIKRIYVDRLTGGETAAQMRDLIIASIHGARLYVLTENQERADAVLRGAAEDLIYTDQFASSDSVDLRSGVNTGNRSTRTSSATVCGTASISRMPRQSSTSSLSRRPRLGGWSPSSRERTRRRWMPRRS